jgi:hypothetical protein
MLINGMHHFNQPSLVFDRFQQVCRGKEFDAIHSRIAQRTMNFFARCA